MTVVTYKIGDGQQRMQTEDHRNEEIKEKEYQHPVHMIPWLSSQAHPVASVC